MSRNGDSQQQQTQELMAEPSATTKLTWQWQKKASLRNIENSMSELKDRLSSIHSEVEASRKEDKREIKLLLDDLAVARAKAARMEKTIEEMRREKVAAMKMNEELLSKKDEEIQGNLKDYEGNLLIKEEELKRFRKEALETMASLREAHGNELKVRDEKVSELEAQHAEAIAVVLKEKSDLQKNYEERLEERQGEIERLTLKFEAEAEELRQAKEAAVNELNEKIDQLSLKLGDAVIYLRNASHLLEVKNAFICKQRQGFEKIVDHIGETDPKPTKLKGNLWRLAHYVRTGGQAAWKGYINRAQYDAVTEEADAIKRVASRALIDNKFEGEDEEQFRVALKELFTQLG